MQAIISFLMALVLAVTAAGNAPDTDGPAARRSRPEDETVTADPLLPREAQLTPTETDAPRAAGHFEELPTAAGWVEDSYEHYDPAAFYEDTDALASLAESEDAEAVLALYDKLIDELARIDTLASVAYIRSCADLADSELSDESVYSETLFTEAADALAAACRDVLAGPCGERLAGHIGKSAAEQLADYVPMTDREAELTAREAELVDLYHERMNDAGDVTYSYLGETWDWDMISGFPGTSLAYRDYDGYLEVYYGLQKELNDIVGPIFTELVSIRAELADIEGYDSYADLAYEQAFGRDYGQEEAELLCKAVQDLAPTYYQELFYSPLWYDYSAVWPVMDRDELLETLGRYVGMVDPMLDQSWQFMLEHSLYNVDQGEDRFPGSFTIPLSHYGSAYIFSQLNGDCTDLSTLSHEFGHFTYDRLHPAPSLLAPGADYDLLEIHSTGLEVLLTEYYDEIYADSADTARFLVLGDLMEAVLDGCIYDEFQRQVYADPDMSLDEINRLFAGICSKYGLEEPLNVDYAWMYVSHNFESPLYYISYAVSALAAAQIWDMAREDWQDGVDAWLAVMEADAYEDGYMTVLPACGLRLFTEEGAVEKICRPLLKELARLDAEA